VSFIQNLYTSRDNNANGSSYVGQQDRIWWNPDTNSFYYSDGNTAGGIPVSVANTANIVLNTATITGNLVVLGNITAAANNKIGGIAPGAGVNISNAGILTIDSANLPVSFGNFYANNNILSIVNQDQNMILDTQGNAEIQLVGNVGFYKTGNTPPTVSDRYASFSDTGVVAIRVTATGNSGAVNIIGSTSGNEITPGQPGAMLHITGQLTVPTRLYFDGNANYVSIVNRRFNGNVANPTQVLAGEDVFRINATAATDAGVGNTAFAQIRATALENQTTAAQGSALVFTVTPIGANTSSRVDVANITTANGVSATLFTTSGTVSATGNITGGNVITAGLITATGNVTANYFVGNGSALTGQYGNANVVANLAALGSNPVSTTGNINSNNVIATTIVNAASYTGTLVSVTGNVTANNVIATTISNAASHTGAVVSVTGNVTANFFVGNGSALTGVVSSYGNANVVANLAALGSNPVSTTGNVTANNVIATTIVNAASHTGTLVSVTGNVTANNGMFTTIVNTASFTGSTVSVTGNITGANVNISTSGTLTTPRILYNDGGIRTLTGNTAVTLDFATDSMVSLTNPTNTVTITLANYVAGASITFICSSATARQINTGVAAAVNSTTGAANINTGGGGIGPNQSVILRYYCVSGNAATTYVSASYQ
jgi:hypothetical protein